MTPCHELIPRHALITRSASSMRTPAEPSPPRSPRTTSNYFPPAGTSPTFVSRTSLTPLTSLVTSRRRGDQEEAEQRANSGGGAATLRQRRRGAQAAWPPGRRRSSDPTADAAQRSGAQDFVAHFAGEENHQVCQSLLFPSCCVKRSTQTLFS